MVNVTRSLLVLSLLVGAPAFAASQATVGVKIAELRIKPDEGAFSRLKIPGGREVALLGKSDDGRWIKVRTEIEKGDDIIKLEGWLEAAQLKGADPSSLAVAGSSSSGSSSSGAWGDTPASSSSTTESWAPTESSETPAWGDEPAAAPAPAATEWGSPAPASESSESKEAWDAAPATSSDSSGDSWGSDSGSSDSGSSDSSSGDSWESTDSGSSDDSGW